MSEPKRLLVEAVVAVHRILVADHGGLPRVRDASSLSSALSRPRQLAAYGDGRTIPELAAAYCYGLARSHPFVGGNKHIALNATGILLGLNGYVLSATEADAVFVMEGLAADEIEESELAAWFSENARAM